jgi:hypothetical protein
MATVRVTHTIGGLQRDLTTIATTTRAKLVPVVKRNVEQGNRLAQKFARQSSGPHGRLYYKRITGEMTGTLEGEYGPTGNVVGNAVGAGWRSGPPNTDLPKSADIQGPKFAKDVGDVIDGLFWP